MHQLLNQQLGNYQIIDLLGEGGMGTVYKAQHSTLQNEVAIKVMHAQFARQQIFRHRFLQEARIAANLNHPGIVRVSDFGEDKGYLFIVMEFIPGGNLQEFLHSLRVQGQWIALGEAIHLIRRIALALDYAHRHGIYHRDVKPANIMVKLSVDERERYAPVVTDLGLAKLNEGGMDTMPHSTLGTPAYMSPEQAEGNEVDARSDVYSLGVLLYELTVGCRPFQINTLTEAIRHHTQSLPPKPRSVNPNLPAHLEQIILKTLEKNPAKRFSSARAFAQALVEIVPPELSNTLPPTALGGESSLLTQVQQSLILDRGQSLVNEFPHTVSPRSTGGSHIQVMKPDGAAYTVPISKATLLVGRGAEADITLEDPKISRQHLSIESQGSRYLVNDLGSTNGSYMGNSRLRAAKPTEWPSEQPLRLGSHNLRLIPAVQTVVSNSQPYGTNQSTWQSQPTYAEEYGQLNQLQPLDNKPTYHGSVVPPSPIPRSQQAEGNPRAIPQPESNMSSKSNMRSVLAWVIPLLLLLLVGGGGFILYRTLPDSSAGISLATTPTFTSSPTASTRDGVAQASTPTPIDTPTSDQDLIETDTPIPTPTFTPPPDTATPLPTATESPTSTSTPIPTPTDTLTPIPPTPIPPTPTPLPIDTPTVTIIEPAWISVPGGEFVMGSDDSGINAHVADCNASEGTTKGIQCEYNWFRDEGPDRRIFLSDFQITKYEITNREYQQCINAGRCGQRGISSDTDIFDNLSNFEGTNRPVIGVSSFDARDYCAFVGGRLPTEEEWEKAARGPNGSAYPWGNSFDPTKANTCDSGCSLDNFRFFGHNDGASRTASVGSYPSGASPYGAMDMAGNVWEWTSSPHNGKQLIKGGGWSKWFHQSRSAERTEVRPDYENFDIGIRCVK